MKHDQTVVIIGGTSGIGLATARLATTLFSNIWITGRSHARLDEALADLDHVRGEALDGADQDAMEAFFSKVGAVDHLVLCASGSNGAGALPELRADDLRVGFEAKFWVHWTCVRSALPYIRPGGSVTFVSAASARTANPGTSGLAAINGAINAMVLPLAHELAPVRVNAVSPGVIDTAWWDQRPAEMKQGYFESVSAATPAGRVGKPEEVAQAILFLMTCGFTTGVVLDVDGGLRTATAS